MPEVKRFINNELPLFHNVEFKSIPGAIPELVTLNAANEVIERIDLSKLNQEECRKLVLKKGFYKKSSGADIVPEKFKNGPYKERTDEEVENILEDIYNKNNRKYEL